MPISAETLRALVKHGLQGDALIEVVEAIDRDMSTLSSGGQSGGQSGGRPVDTAAERRRSWDRDRQARRRSEAKAADTSGGRQEPEDPLPPAPPSPSKTPSKNPPKGGQKGFPLPPDWKPTEASMQRAAERGLTEAQALDEAQAMRDWSASEAGRAISKKSNWDTAFDNWIRRKYPLPKAKAELSVERELEEIVKQYPKRDKPMGTALAETLEAYAEARKAASAAEILAGAMGYAAEVKKRPKDQQDDRFIPSLKRFLAEHRWKNYHAKTPTNQGIPEPLWRSQIENFQKGRQWPQGLGPRPGDAGCKAPEHLLVEFGYKSQETATAVAG